MIIINTGGTFNKRYDPVTGDLVVPFDNMAVEAILGRFTYGVEVAGLIYKDSLDMTAEDRRMMADVILASEKKTFVIVHGTDTMHLSAAFLAELVKDRIVILTGAMVPFSIDPVEATANLAMALGFAEAEPEPGVYVCMQGIVAPHEKIIKNRETGKFERV
jgi:L-asparaginase